MKCDKSVDWDAIKYEIEIRYPLGIILYDWQAFSFTYAISKTYLHTTSISVVLEDLNCKQSSHLYLSMFCGHSLSKHWSNGWMSVAGNYLNQHWFSTNSNSLEIRSGNGMWFKLRENFHHSLGHWDICHAFMAIQHDSVQWISLTHLWSMVSPLKYSVNVKLKDVGFFFQNPCIPWQISFNSTWLINSYTVKSLIEDTPLWAILLLVTQM